MSIVIEHPEMGMMSEYKKEWSYVKWFCCKQVESVPIEKERIQMYNNEPKGVYVEKY